MSFERRPKTRQRRNRRHAGAALAAVAASLAAASVAGAHPHVWVAVETTVVYDKGAVSALRQRWTFDELYSTMAVEGLDANKDGNYDKSELAELTKVNMEGLKDFEYFTFAKLADQPLAFDAPQNAWMEFAEGASPGPTSDLTLPAEPKPKDGFWSNLTKSMTGKAPAAPEKPKVLSLNFTLPLKQPVLAEAKGFNFTTTDPSFYIWFDLAKADPIKLADGAPKGCKAEIGDPTKGGNDLQKLGEQAIGQAGGQMAGLGTSKSVTMSCPTP